MADDRITVIKNRRWTNWHESVGGKVARQVVIVNPSASQATLASYNETTDALRKLLAEAVSEGWTVRAVGGGWSFSPVAQTDGMLIDTRFLNHQFRLQDHLVHPDCPLAAENLHFAQCGTAVAELNLVLGQHGKSLATSGASNGQTIAGATATGTHGSAIDVGAVHDTVRGLHLVTGPDRHVWLERATSPMLADDFAGRLGAELVRDDDLFQAAVVNLGAMGVVHGVLLEVEDRFWLQVYRRRMEADDSLWNALDGLDFSAVDLPRGPDVRPYHFQAVINPHDGDPRPYVTVMYKDELPAPGATRVTPESTLRPGDHLPELMAHAVTALPDLTPALANQVLARMYGDIDGEVGALGEVFGNTTTRGKLASTAMGIPLGRVREAVTELRALNARHPFLGLFALRYVKATDATLGFTRHGQRTCILELDGVTGRRTDAFYDGAWDMLAERGIPFTFHWGKMQRRSAGLTRSMYGDAVDAWLAARGRLMPDPAVQRRFVNGMLRELGLGGAQAARG